MKKPSDLEGVDPALHIEPDEFHPGVHTLRHDDGNHVVDPEQRDQHQGGAGQLPAKQTQVRLVISRGMYRGIRTHVERKSFLSKR